MSDTKPGAGAGTAPRIPRDKVNDYEEEHADRRRTSSGSKPARTCRTSPGTPSRRPGAGVGSGSGQRDLDSKTTRRAPMLCMNFSSSARSWLLAFMSA